MNDPLTLSVLDQAGMAKGANSTDDVSLLRATQWFILEGRKLREETHQQTPISDNGTIPQPDKLCGVDRQGTDTEWTSTVWSQCGLNVVSVLRLTHFLLLCSL
ncbi:hypothetical protein DPEC_G00212860 [Dallia pectoralis]|uniref:Uncharacterized protein n=1 Tax=Dallia pectoralis TaxID=75939 RepID=A0ACC2G6G3_DALPE|nr:hypothetical protein DPEC_G00212860 [Dallia pectoralis]